MPGMATNTTTKKPATAAEENAEAVTQIAEARPERARPRVVGPPLREDEKPVPVTLSHHLRIDGTDYTPGAEIHVSPDYARRLRGQGFIART